MKSTSNARKKEEKRIKLSRMLIRRINILFNRLEIEPKAFILRSGFSERKFYRLFHVGANPTYHTLCELADALNVPLMQLFNFDEPADIEPPVSEEELQNLQDELTKLLMEDDYEKDEV